MVVVNSDYNFQAQTEASPTSKEKMESTEKTQLAEVVDQPVDTHEKKSPQESFAELRKAKEDFERQLWQANKEKELLEKQIQMQAQYQQPAPTPEEDFDYRELEREEFPDGKKLVKAFNTFNKQLSQKDKALAEANQKLAILELAQEHADFKEVVTAENIEKYIKSDEDNREAVELAYQTGKNPLRKVYNLIKKDARYQAEKAQAKPKPVSQEQQRVDEREGKPKVTSIGVRSDAVSTAAAMSNSKMTKDQKMALWKETLSAARR